jgi:dihydroorotase
MSSFILRNTQLATATGTVQDLHIEDGVIRAIGKGLPAAKGAKEIELNGAWVSPGWFDIGVQACDPGFEHREDLQSAIAAAAAGGFTGMAVFPNTHPPVQSKSELLYIQNKTKGAPVSCIPIGAVSADLKGKDMAELFDMHAAGALAFSDGTHGIQDAGLLMRALQYVQAFNGLIIDQAHHEGIASGGQMHEGIWSTKLGMRGMPALAEDIMVQRNLNLLEYTGGRLHMHLVSSAKSVTLIRAAKKAGLNVSCSVAVANLVFTDEQLQGFNSNYKVHPPLRLESDRQALIQGLTDGTIDFIASNHTPWDEEAKNLEFPFAQFGILGLQTAVSASWEVLEKHLDLAEFLKKWWSAPRDLLGLSKPEIEVGKEVNITIFDPQGTWSLETADILSKSQNTPFLGKTLKGRVLGIIHGNQAVWADQ